MEGINIINSPSSCFHGSIPGYRSTMGDMTFDVAFYLSVFESHDHYLLWEVNLVDIDHNTMLFRLIVYFLYI